MYLYWCKTMFLCILFVSNGFRLRQSRSCQSLLKHSCCFRCGNFAQTHEQQKLVWRHKKSGSKKTKHHWNRSLSWKFQIHSFPKTAVTKTFLVYLYPRTSTVQVVHKEQPPVLEAHLALLNRILVMQEFKDRVFSHNVTTSPGFILWSPSMPFPCWIRRKNIFHCHSAHQGELGTAFCSPEETPCLPPRVREAMSLDKDSWPWIPRHKLA